MANETQKMPALFIGHGSPMNAIEDNDYTRNSEHFYPLLYVLGALKEDDRVSIFNDSCVLGSMSMTSYLFLSNEKHI